MPDDTAFRPGRHQTACPHDCPSTCSLEVDVSPEGRVGRLRGHRDNGYTDGVICAKVARYSERVHHPDRLTQPLRRIGAKGDGQFAPISWEEALDIVAARFKQAAADFGPESVLPYAYGGTMGLVQSGAAERLRATMGYARTHSTICSALGNTGFTAGAGAIRGVDPREIALSDLIVVWGTNPVSTQVNVMTHIAKARKKRGAKLIVIDPYRTGTAEQADVHLCLKPGTDGALACAVMHVLFRDGHADLEYLDRYADDWRGLRDHLASRTPAWAAAITGLSVAEIEDFATAYGTTRNSFLRLGFGFTRSRNGAVAMHAVSCLPAITGAWAHPGGGALYQSNALYDHDTVLINASDSAKAARPVRRIDMARIGPALLGEADDLSGGPPIMAMLIQNCNPAAICPDSHLVAQGLAREDLFLCVHEQFMTDTARYADIVLPATTFLEHDDYYVAGGHTHVVIGPQIIEPLGESRSNHEVIRALGQRLGIDHRSFTMTAREIADETLQKAGWGDFASLAAVGWRDVTPSFEKAHFLDGFETPSRRFQLRPNWEQFGPRGAGMPEYPDHWDVIEQPSADQPFRLVTAPARNFLNTSFTETPTSQAKEERPTALIHPEDGARLGIASGDRIQIGNDRGRLTLHARLFDGLQPGTVVVESIWPGRAFPEGIGINSLVGAAPGFPRGGAAYHDTAIWLRPAPLAAAS